jgi:uncharacterized protein (DUF1501 family)
MSHINKNIGRREFLRRAGAISAFAGSPFAFNLATIGSAAAQSAGDYRAIVCVYLNGGNDQSNTVVPVSTAEYNAYRTGRAGLALAQNAPLPIAPMDWSGPQLGLHPSLSGMQQLFNQGRCGILANVGMLSNPITRSEWNAGSPRVTVPFQLESHSDQTTQWHTCVPNAPSSSGWLGRAADLITPAYGGNDLSICISVAGNNLIQSGATTIPYAITTRGAVHIGALDSLGGSVIASQSLRRLMTQQRTHLLEQQLNTTAQRSIEAEALVTSALGQVNVPTTFPQSALGSQLQMVARLIAARNLLGHRRQVFYVSIGGWDFHDNLLAAQANLLGQVSAAISAFYQATVDLGVANNVTTFTASEFGRALQANNDGSDHGWGGHHFIVGGAVRGGRMYGKWPRVAMNSEDDARRGILIPTTAVDQYASTLAKWLGVSTSNMASVVPNIGRFNSADLGIFA